MSEFNKEVGKFIDKVKEEKLRNNWKKTKIVSQSSFIGSDMLHKLLGTHGAIGLRIYYGMDDEGNMQPIFYASDAKGRPIITPSLSKTSEEDTGGGADATMVCPPYCPE
jgi:hypothetical protein